MIDEKIANVVKIDASEGDVLLVTLPESASNLPRNRLEEYSEHVMSEFNRIFAGKEIKTVVVPYGMKVEIVRASTFADKE